MVSTVKNIKLINGNFAEIHFKDGSVEKRQFPVSALDIKDQLSESDVKRLLRTEESDKIQVPLILLPFYFYVIFSNGKVPDQEALLKSYNKFYKKDGKYVQEYTDLPDGKFIKERIFRAQPSLVRDFHFYALCCNSGYFDHVEYDLIRDVREDCDVTVELDGKSVDVCLFVRTKASQEWRKKKIAKAEERERDQVLVSCDLTSNESTTDKTGGYVLYTDKHLDILKAYFKFS